MEMLENEKHEDKKKCSEGLEAMRKKLDLVGKQLEETEKQRWWWRLVPTIQISCDIRKSF